MLECPERKRTMSISTMYGEFKADMQNASKVEAFVFNEWHYTFIETCRGATVAISDPRGRFVSYEKLPGPRNPNLSPNI
jgi:hypothetical protein